MDIWEHWLHLKSTAYFINDKKLHFLWSEIITGSDNRDIHPFYPIVVLNPLQSDLFMKPCDVYLLPAVVGWCWGAPRPPSPPEEALQKNSKYVNHHIRIKTRQIRDTSHVNRSPL